MHNSSPITVTRASLPSFDEYSKYLKEIMESGWLTNNGHCVQKLEDELVKYLHCPNLIVSNNGTSALMLALHCAGLRGKKVALTAYTYVATLSAILWIGCTPVFVDIDPKTLCMSSESLKEAFSKHEDIAGVIPVHIYGLVCDDESLSSICREHNAVLIYDGAQAFGSMYGEKSVLELGDYSICSFHATKIFHCVEGGCIIAHDAKAKNALALARAFGHIGDSHYTLGINAKMSELHAAMGLCLLPHVAAKITKRKKIHAVYDKALRDLPLTRPIQKDSLLWNYAYYPILLPNEKILKDIISRLSKINIFSRRYFYPSLNTLPYVEYSPCPVAENSAKRSLCLPLYDDLEIEVIHQIISVIHSCI